MPTNPQPTVAIAGGGLAGLSAACALSDAGFRVTLFEKRPFLGGRASSYEHPGTGEVIDNCQHVLFRSCTNLIAFYERIGVADQIRWSDEMTFLEPGGRATVMRSSFLPAPLHTAPSFLRFPFLTAPDKLAIARALVPIMLANLPDDGRNFQQWLDQHGQTRGAVEHFWKPVLISALSDELDRVSISAAAQVVRVSMMSAAAGHMGVPTLPLTDLYNAAGDYIRARRGTLHFRQPVLGFTTDSSHIQLQLRNHRRDQHENQQNRAPLGAPSLSLRSLEGQGGDFDYLILALPFDALDKILPQSSESSSLREQLSHLENSAITGIHLWFDRQITDLDHAVLLDRTVQWMFHKSRLQPLRNRGKFASEQERSATDFGGSAAPEQCGSAVPEQPGRAALQGRVSVEEMEGDSAAVGSYIELVVSSSKNLIDKSRSEIVDLGLKEVREFFPAARNANLVKSTVIKEVNATYSPRPGIDAHRPTTLTPWPRVFLAGDWTATGWPATMESAVRSGYLAAEALLRAASVPSPKLLVPDLPATGLMRLLR